MLGSTFASRWTKTRIAALATLLPVLTLGMLFVTSGVASAHASYVSSNPAANALLKAAPSSVTITFAEEVAPSGSGIIVYDSQMKQVSTADATADASDLKIMSVPMRGDDSEVYVVVWHTTSADDGDTDAGAFAFYTNAEAVPATDSTPGPSSDSSSGGTPVWLTVLVGVLGLVVGGGATYYFVGRNAAAK